MDWLRNANWLNSQRLSIYPKTFALVYLLAAILLIALGNGMIDPLGRPLGTDFISLYAAGLLTHERLPEAAYDWPKLFQKERAVAGAGVQFYSWAYPPFYLAIAWIFAWLPYSLALLAFLILTFLGYWFVLRQAAPSHPLVIWLIVGFPGVFTNAGHGQNGFLTAALLGGGLLLLWSRPYLAGILFGLLSYKPQLGLLIPIALLAGRHWKATVTASLTVAVLTIFTTAIFGYAIWDGFFRCIQLSQRLIIEQGATGWYKLQSVYSAVRLAGGSNEFAYTLQAFSSIGAAAAVAWFWSRTGNKSVKATVLCCAIPLASPFVNDYDLTILALPIAFLVQEAGSGSFLPYEKSLLASLWLLPFAARPVSLYARVPLTPLLMALTVLLCVTRINASRWES